MAILINVPNKDSNKVKLLGAKWKPQYKKWCVERKADYPKFIQWILRNENYTSIVCDFFYIAEATLKCEYCNSETKVIAFGIENCLEIKDYYSAHDFPYEYIYGDIFFSSFIDPLPNRFKTYLRQKYNYYDEYDFSDVYGTNHCINCGSMQGQPGFLIDIFEKPACIRDQKINLYKVKLNYDLISDVNLYLCDYTDNFNKDEDYNNFFDSGIEI